MAHGNPYQSCLKPYEDEIFKLRLAGGKKKPATYEEIANLLCEKYQVKVTRSAVYKFVKVRKNLHKIGKPTDTAALYKLRRQPFEFKGTITRLSPEEAARFERQLDKEEELEGLSITDVAVKIMQLEDEIARLKQVEADNYFLEMDKDILKEESHSLNEEVSRLKRSYEYMDETRRELVKRLEDLEEENSRISRRLWEQGELEAEIAELKKENAGHKEKIDRLNFLLNDETARRQKLEKEAAGLREKLAAEQTARQSSLSWKVKKLISG
jgi:chromosome segregation ATPase